MPDISDDSRLLEELYVPPTNDFVLLDVPEMRFLMIDGSGDHGSEPFTQGTRWLISRSRTHETRGQGTDEQTIRRAAVVG